MWCFPCSEHELYLRLKVAVALRQSVWIIILWWMHCCLDCFVFLMCYCYWTISQTAENDDMLRHQQWLRLSWFVFVALNNQTCVISLYFCLADDWPNQLKVLCLFCDMYIDLSVPLFALISKEIWEGYSSLFPIPTVNYALCTELYCLIKKRFRLNSCLYVICFSSLRCMMKYRVNARFLLDSYTFVTHFYLFIQLHNFFFAFYFRVFPSFLNSVSFGRLFAEEAE